MRPPLMNFRAMLLLPLLMTAAAIGYGAAPARAQNVQRIAAIVNDEVISRYDVEQRVGLVIATSRLNDTAATRRRLRQQILRSLIDESLQLQAAKRHSIQVGKKDLGQAYRYIEQQNNVPAGGLNNFLKQARIPRPALDAQLRAEISWSKLVRRRLGRNVQIGDEEIDEVLARLQANAGRSEQRISEIFLPVDSPDQAEEVRRAGIGLLRQLRDGASFAAMARQFSRGATAAQGGAAGWVQPGQLAPALDIAIAKLQVDEISQPIEAAGGYYLIQLHERRRIATAGESGMKLTLKQIMLSLAKEAKAADFEARERMARNVAASAKDCGDFDDVAKALQAADADDLGEVNLTDLPPNIADAVKDLAVGRFSAPIRQEQKILLLMVCKREEIKGRGPDRDSISNNLARRRLAMLAQRYLRDLRRSAVVELR
ncbi:MAG: peptidylprolyl isomerase [Alphaproteobacteria bacterium]|nr:peptidylprolyl isomerase [Alphaproteobacteria bacterium]